MKKALPLTFGVIFLLFAALQYNDPDPQVWVPIYGFAALACAMAYAQIGNGWFFGSMALIYGVAAAYQWPPAFEGFLLNEVGMKTVNIELGRESLGLGCCTIAMWICAALKN